MALLSLGNDVHFTFMTTVITATLTNHSHQTHQTAAAYVASNSNM